MDVETQIITDYHMHSTFSPDADHSPEMMCQRALELGLTEIAITEHAEWHPKMPLNGLPKVAAYFEAIAACRAQFEPLGLRVYSGVELGNPHHYPVEAAALLAKHNFEVVVASLHWLAGQNIHEAVCFADRDPDEVYADYFAELGQMTMNFEFDILAHFDRILWRGTLLGHTFEPRHLEPEIRDALSIIARHGRTLELNTTFLAHQLHWRPALTTMFAWFREEGGTRVVVNSDAHRTHEVGRNRALAEALLCEAGFSIPEQLLHVGHRQQAKLLPAS